MTTNFIIPFASLTRLDMNYHNWSHITRMLSDAQKYFPNEADDIYLNAAIFWHDAVYRVGASQGENELDSANLFAHTNHDYFTLEERERVCEMILATAHHFDETTYNDYYTNILLDLDIMTFAYSYVEFKKINRAIASENLIFGRAYEDVVNGTIHFLKNIVLPNITFRVIPNKEEFKERAIDNIELYLSELETELWKDEPFLLKFFEA